MSKLYLLFVLLVVIGLVAYWAYYPNAPTGSAVTVLLGAQNSSGESGTVTVRDDAKGYARVVVTLANEPTDASQPMHFHAGSCALIGAVKHTLNNVVNGRSETTLEVSTAQLMSQLPMAVNVHRSNAEMGIYVACGDVR